MVNAEEKARRKELRKKYEEQYAEKERQKQLKETLKSRWRERKEREQLGVPEERPFAKLAAVEKEIAEMDKKEGVGSGSGSPSGNEAGTAPVQESPKSETRSYTTNIYNSGSANKEKKEEKTEEKLSDGFIVFIIGLLWYLAKFVYVSFFQGGSFLGTNFGLIPLIYEVAAGYALLAAASILIFRRRGLLFNFLFFGVYFSAAYINAYFWFLLFAATAVLLIKGYFQNEKISVWIKREVSVGLGLLFLLFLDIGLPYILLGDSYLAKVPFIGTLALPLTQIVAGMIKLIPWWAVLGAFTIDTEKRGGKFSWLRPVMLVGMIVYLAFVIIFAISPLGQLKDVSVPGIGELQRAREQAEITVSKKVAPPYIKLQHTLSCIIDLGSVINYEECMKKKEKEYSIEKSCGEKTGEEKARCIQDITAELEGKKVAGRVDAAIPYVMLQAAGKDILKQYEPGNKVSFEIKAENQRDEEIKIALGCEAEYRDQKQQLGVAPESKTLGRRQKTEETFYCIIPESFDGIEITGINSIKITAFVTIKELTTAANLERVFIGEREKEEELISRYAGKLSAASKVPDDPVSLDLSMESSVTIGNENPFLSAYINNRKRGEIVAIHSSPEIILYAENAESLLQIADSGKCTLQKYGERYFNPSFQLKDDYKKQESIQYASCELDLGALKTTEDIVPALFQSRITYDYRISSQVSIKVNFGSG